MIVNLSMVVLRLINIFSVISDSNLNSDYSMIINTWVLLLLIQSASGVQHEFVWKDMTVLSVEELSIIQVFKNTHNWPKLFFNCSGYKMTHSLVIFLIFKLVANNWHLFNDKKSYISGLNCLDICNYPGWLGDSKKFELNEKFCFFSFG